MNRILPDTPIPSQQCTGCNQGAQRTKAAPLEQPAAHTGMYVTGFLLAACFFVVAAAHRNCPQRERESERERERERERARERARERERARASKREREGERKRMRGGR